MASKSEGRPAAFAELEARNRRAEEGGGAARLERQRRAGRLTARERIAVLVDAGSFEETGRLVQHRSRDFGLDRQRYPGDGVVTGYARIDGRLAYLFAQDFTVLGGSLSEAVA